MNIKKTIRFLVVLILIHLGAHAQNVVPIYFRELGAYTFADVVTKQPVKPVVKFDNAKYLGFGFWAVDNGSSNLDKKQALFNSKGNQLTDFKYKNIYSLFEKSKLIKFEENEKYGVIDTFGKEKCSAKYDYLDINAKEGMHKVRFNKKGGFINDLGQEIIACKYVGRVADFFEGLALIDETKEGEEYKSIYYIDKTGKIALKPAFKNIENIGNFSEGLAAIDCAWESNSFSVYGFIDKKGNMIIEPQFTSIFPSENAFKNGYTSYGTSIYDKIAQKHKNVCGVINKKGDIVIKAEYSFIYPVSNDMFKVEKDSLNGILSTSGKIIVPIKYKDVWAFSLDKKQFIVNDNNQYFIVDSLNNTIKTFKNQYDRLTKAGNGIYRGKQGKIEMYLNEQEEVIAEIEKDLFRNEITFHDYFIIVRKGSIEKYYDLKGKEFKE